MLSIILSLLLTTSGLQITVTAPAGCRPCYVQVDGAHPAIYQFDLNAGESFGATSAIGAAGGSARVRVWTETSGQDADVDQTIALPAAYRVYLPR